jgi:hypothetical protein
MRHCPSSTRDRRPQSARVRPQPWIIAALLLAAGSEARAAGLVVEEWFATACAVIGGPGRATECSAANPGFVANTSGTSPGVSGPILLQPTTAHAAVSGGTEAYQTAGGWNGANAGIDSNTYGLHSGAFSSASLTVLGVNTDATPASYSFHFLINGGGLTLATSEFVALGERRPKAEIVAAFQISSGLIDTGGPNPVPNVLALWSYRATMVANNSESNPIFTTQIQDPFNLGLGTPSTTVQQITNGSVRSATMSLAPFVGTVPNLNMAPGSPILLHYRVEALVYTGDHDPIPNPIFDEPSTNASAWIADPFGLEGNGVPDGFPSTGFELGGQSLASLTAVPEPEPGALLLIGLCTLAAVSRRARSRAS